VPLSALELGGSYSGHSLRSGFVTSAMDAGTDIFSAANHGRWKRLETMREYDRRNKGGRTTPAAGSSEHPRGHDAPCDAPDRVR
jgi:hypothetical protein